MGIFDWLKRKLHIDIINNNGVNEIYENKKLVKKYYMKNGKIHGKYLEYDYSKNSTGQEIKDFSYKNGEKHGDCYVFKEKKQINDTWLDQSGIRRGTIYIKDIFIKKQFDQGKQIGQEDLIEVDSVKARLG